MRVLHCFDDSRGWSKDCELKDLRCPTPSLSSMGLGSSIMSPFGPILRAAVSFSMTESMIRSLSASEPNALAMAGARKWTCAEARALDVAGARVDESRAIFMPTIGISLTHERRYKVDV